MRRTPAVRRASLAGIVLCAAVTAGATAHAQSPSLMEPHRAARIEAACADAVRPDWPHYVLGGTMAVIGALGYIPNFVDPPAERPAYSQLSAGMGLGMFASGVILMLRPMGPGAVRLEDTCARLLDGRRDNSTLLRDAERALNRESTAQGVWAFRISLVAAGVTVLGSGLAALIAPNDHDRFFWSGVFLTLPLALWIDLLVPPAPVRAALRFRRIPEYRRSALVVPLALGGGAGVGVVGAW